MKAVVYTNPKDGVQRPGTKLKIISVNLFRFQQLENYQRRKNNRSRLQRDPQFDHDLIKKTSSLSNRDLAPVR